MKALLTAGGRATRLRPITHTINKHLIPLANKPMIVYAIERLKEAGITEVFINVNPGEKEIHACLGDGSGWGVRIQYIEQTGGPKGLAHIIKNAEPYLRGGPFVFYLGDNIIVGSLKEHVAQFEREQLDGLFAFAHVKDPQRFGVAVLENGKLTRIEEKPAVPKSSLAQTGIYFYSDAIFDVVRDLQPSARGEYEISDENTRLIEMGKLIVFNEVSGWWKDTGKPEDLLEGNQILLQHELSREALIEGTIGPNVTIQGYVRIGKGTVIWDNVLIRGPVAIGENTIIKGSYIGPYTSIGNHCTIEDTELENTVVMDHAILKTHNRIVDSIVGKNASVMSARHTFPSGHKLIIGENSSVEV